MGIFSGIAFFKHNCYILAAAQIDQLTLLGNILWSIAIIGIATITAARSTRTAGTAGTARTTAAAGITLVVIIIVIVNIGNLGTSAWLVDFTDLTSLNFFSASGDTARTLACCDLCIRCRHGNVIRLCLYRLDLTLALDVHTICLHINLSHLSTVRNCNDCVLSSICDCHFLYSATLNADICRLH